MVLELTTAIGGLLLAILLPLVLLIGMTVALVWRLATRQRVGAATHFADQKRTVTRITIITTALQVGADQA